MFQAVLKSTLMRAGGQLIIDPRNFTPAKPDIFSIDFEIFVSLKGLSEGFERFDVEVCTPRWLEQTVPEGDCLMGAGLLLVRSYSYECIFRYIENYIERCAGKTVEDVFRRVGLIGAWESEWEM